MAHLPETSVLVSAREPDRADRQLLSFRTRVKLYLVFWIAIIVSFAVTALTQLERFYSFAEQEAQLREQIAYARQITKELEHDLEFHYSDAFVERVARDRLGFIRADETIFINDAAK